MDMTANSALNRTGRYAARCRRASSDTRRYYRILVQRERQPDYRTEFYGCVACSTIFTDLYRFTQSVKGGTKRFGSASYDRSHEY
jgi:hypothetical protein